LSRKRILFISGSLGLGHIVRDLAIAGELRAASPEIELSWLAAHPATVALADAGEELLPEADEYADDNTCAEDAARGMRLNLLKYLSRARGAWARNVEAFKKATAREQYDLVIGDEAYEIGFALMKDPSLRRAPFVMIYDFLGLEPMSNSPLERLGVYAWNRMWVKALHEVPPLFDMILFVGEEEDVPDKKFGFLLPNRRQTARARFQFVGYILRFDPGEYLDRRRIRAELGFGEEPLVVCSIGGTSIGGELLKLCGQAYPIIREAIPDVRMVLVCGPRLAADSLQVPESVEVRGYVPALFEHFAASDLAIVLGGGTSTLELTALRRPFVYFPLERHFEQQAYVAERLARHGAGVKMMFSETTPAGLAQRVVAELGKEVAYPPLRTDGARRAADLIRRLL
jgi:predicted glycosyltransferase